MKKSVFYTILAWALVTAVVMFAGVLIGLKITGNTPGSADQAMTMTASSAASDLSVGGSADSIKIPGFEKMVLKAGQLEQAVNFYNPEENACYFRITLALADGTELFHSGMIKPGQKIGNVEIFRSLKAGTYKDAVLQYDCYDLEGLQPLNGSKIVLDLEVKP